MSLPHNTPPRRAPADAASKQGEPLPATPNPGADAGADSGARLAHELASLLDGSLRNVSLVMSSLQDHSPAAKAARQGKDVVKRLESANQSLRQMALLIHRWMGQTQRPHALFQDVRTLGEVIEQTVRTIAPVAAQRHVDIDLNISDQTAALPAGAVYPFIANGLRNSIEAISPAAEEPRPGKISLSASIEKGWVELSIHDNGPGIDRSLLDEKGKFRFGQSTKPEGHGIGLVLCQDIAQSLGGTLELTNHPGGGALLKLRYPVPSEPGELQTPSDG